MPTASRRCALCSTSMRRVPDLIRDPLYGEQEGRHFHGYYDCYCYLPLYVFLWSPPARGQAALVERRCRRRQRRRGRAHRRPDPRALAGDVHRDPRRQRVLPRRSHELVRGQWRPVCARPCRQQPPQGPAGTGDEDGEAQIQKDRPAGARVRRLRLPHAPELELQNDG